MAEPYRPRARARLADVAAGDLAVKLHWIDAAGASAPPEDLHAAAVATIARTLPDAIAAEGDPAGAAFAILHRGAQGTWLLMDWWAHCDILCQCLARADPGGTDFRSVADRPLLACLWELEVIAEERGAFIAHMMQADPDPIAWRAA
ncbi:MAG: hypothetical protein AAF390_08330 [Pseudomonadota bacterium]